MEDFIYLIGYDINEQLHDYSDLKEAIMAYGNYQHPIESIWFIRVDGNTDVNTIAGNLRGHLHSDNDHLYVMQVPHNVPRQGWLPRSFWKWLRQQ